MSEDAEMKFEEDNQIQEIILKAIKRPTKTCDDAIAHYPSGLMGCMRSRYYSWMSREDLVAEYGEIISQTTPITEKWLAKQSIFRMGNFVEEELGEWLSMAGLLPSPDRSQFRIRSRKFLISGNIDYMVWLNGQDIPIECKSAKKEMFESWGGWTCTNCGGKMKEKEVTCKDCSCKNPEKVWKWYRECFDRKPSIEHYAQLQSYLNVGNYPFGFLYYYNKNDSTRKWWRVEKDPAFWDTIVAQNDKLMEAVRTKQLPSRPYNADFDLNGDIKDSSDWHCRFCDWARICWADVIKENLTERENAIAKLFGVKKE